MFYPHRLRYAFAVATLAEWTAEPARVHRLLAGLPVLAKTVEIHPSKGTCTYRCAMCLWSDKRTLTYATRDLAADGLLRARTAECLAKYFRPTISPFGIVAPCDLKAEPRFADSRFNLGTIPRHRVLDVVDKMPGQFVPDACTQCMPSSRTGNAVYHKLLTDCRQGLDLSDQPFPLPGSVVA